MKKLNHEKLYSINEFCAIFEIARPTFYNWEKENKINVTTVCGKKKVKETEVNRLMKGE